MNQNFEKWMEYALEQAKLAFEKDEVPVGAVIVFEDSILAATHNQTLHLCDPTAHAEILAIREAAKALGNYRLTNCALYVTKEPCAMCFGATINARIETIVFGTPDPRWGCAGSHIDLAQPGLFNHSIKVISGIKKKECQQLLSEFFKKKRHNNSNNG